MPMIVDRIAQGENVDMARALGPGDAGESIGAFRHLPQSASIQKLFLAQMATVVDGLIELRAGPIVCK